MLFPPPSRTPSYTYIYIYIPTDKEVEELVEREDGVGDKRDEEEEADSKEASSITRQKRPEAKKKQRTPRSRC